MLLKDVVEEFLRTRNLWESKAEVGSYLMVSEPCNWLHFFLNWLLKSSQIWGPLTRKWQPTPVLLPGKSHGRKEHGRLQSMGPQRVGHDWATSLQQILKTSVQGLCVQISVPFPPSFFSHSPELITFFSFQQLVVHIFVSHYEFFQEQGVI